MIQPMPGLAYLEPGPSSFSLMAMVGIGPQLIGRWPALSRRGPAMQISPAAPRADYPKRA